MYCTVSIQASNEITNSLSWRFAGKMLRKKWGEYVMKFAIWSFFKTKNCIDFLKLESTIWFSGTFLEFRDIFFTPQTPTNYLPCLQPWLLRERFVHVEFLWLFRLLPIYKRLITHSQIGYLPNKEEWKVKIGENRLSSCNHGSVKKLCVSVSPIGSRSNKGQHFPQNHDSWRKSKYIQTLGTAQSL